MTKISTVLFDFDGVIADTEPQYDIYIDNLGERYQLGIDNFALKVKGTTSPNMLEKYFSHLSESELSEVSQDIERFEMQMSFPPVDGAIEFIGHLKENGYKIGLVTSSQGFKMKRALEIMNIADSFDTIVTADRITQGKPHPMCYLLAAKDLGSSPAECIVFEDSFHGIQSGKDAGMRVVGLSTTIDEEKLKEKVHHIIPDFSDRKKVLTFLE